MVARPSPARRGAGPLLNLYVPGTVFNMSTETVHMFTCSTHSPIPQKQYVPAVTYLPHLSPQHALFIHRVKAEVFVRGPVSCSIDAGPLLNLYVPGTVFNMAKPLFPAKDWAFDHIIGITGWGAEESLSAQGKEPFWLLRRGGKNVVCAITGGLYVRGGFVGWWIPLWGGSRWMV